jgi:hypothetical protein
MSLEMNCLKYKGKFVPVNKKNKVKLYPYQAVEAYSVVRCLNWKNSFTSYLEPATLKLVA